MAGRPSGLGKTFSALAFSDYRSFAVSLLLTSLGAQLLQTAILWQVHELTGSALALGLTGLARAGPHMVLSLVGGVAADRFNRVRMIQAGQLLNAVLVVALAAMTLAGSVEVWHLYLITSLNSGFTALTQPARTAVIPSLIPRENLVNAVALNATIQQTSQIIGPAMAGIGIAAMGLGGSYILNGVLYLVAMAVIFGVRASTVPEASSESPWKSFVDGLAFVKRRSVIISLLVLDLSQTIFGGYRALLPIFATSLGLGASGYGFLSAAPGLGSVIGAAIILSLGDMRYKGLYTVGGVLGYCVALVMLALSPWFLLTLLAACLTGVANSVQVIPRNSAILQISPDAMRGRVEAFRSMLAGGGPPLGYALSGVLAAAFGAPLALVMGAIACSVVVGGVAIRHRELRDPNLGTAIHGYASDGSVATEAGAPAKAEGRP